MTNSEQLQKNNERIEAVTLLMQSKAAGGGGLDINGDLQEFYALGDVEAGDFITIKHFAGQSMGSPSPLKLHKISDTTYCGFYGNAILSALLITLTSRTTCQATHIVLDSTTQSANGYNVVSHKISEDKFVVLHAYGSSKYLYASVVQFTDGVFTVLASTQCSSDSNSLYISSDLYNWSITDIGDNRYFAMLTSYYSSKTVPALFDFTINEDYSITTNNYTTKTAVEYLSTPVYIGNDTILYAKADQSNHRIYLYKHDLLTQTQTQVGAYFTGGMTNSRPPFLEKINDSTVAILYNPSTSTSSQGGTSLRMFDIATQEYGDEIIILSSCKPRSYPVLTESGDLEFVYVESKKEAGIATISFENNAFKSVTTKTLLFKPSTISSYSATTNYNYPFMRSLTYDNILLKVMLSSPTAYAEIFLDKYFMEKYTGASNTTIQGVSKDDVIDGGVGQAFVPSV